MAVSIAFCGVANGLSPISSSMTSFPAAISLLATARTVKADSTPTDEANVLNAGIREDMITKLVVSASAALRSATQMEQRADGLIRALGLQPHPEGGFYAEVYRGPAVTTIYFLLPAGEKSRW